MVTRLHGYKMTRSDVLRSVMRTGGQGGPLKSRYVAVSPHILRGAVNHGRPTKEIAPKRTVRPLVTPYYGFFRLFTLGCGAGGRSEPSGDLAHISSDQLALARISGGALGRLWGEKPGATKGWCEKYFYDRRYLHGRKRQRTGAVQDASRLTSGSGFNSLRRSCVACVGGAFSVISRGTLEILNFYQI